MKILENTESIFFFFSKKFEDLMDKNQKDHIQLERVSSNEKDLIENYNKDSNFIENLKIMSSLSSKIINNLDTLYSVMYSAKEPNQEVNINYEKEKRMLHVKSDHQLFLIKDLTEEVTKIINNSKATKEEFERVYYSILPRGRQSESSFSEFERSDFTQNREKLEKL